MSHDIDDLVQDCSNSIANTLELLQSCTKPSICTWLFIGWLNIFRISNSTWRKMTEFLKFEIQCKQYLRHIPMCFTVKLCNNIIYLFIICFYFPLGMWTWSKIHMNLGFKRFASIGHYPGLTSSAFRQWMALHLNHPFMWLLVSRRKTSNKRHTQITITLVHHRAPDIQGAVSIRKTVLPGMAIPMLKIRRPNGRLIFNMEITIRR